MRLAGRELPPLCPIKKMTGHRCPGCGMSRGLVYMFRMRAMEAFRANKLSPIAFVLLLMTAFGARSLKGSFVGVAVTAADEKQLFSTSERWNAV